MISRRSLILAPLVALPARHLHASPASAVVVAASGEGAIIHADGTLSDLKPGAELAPGSRLHTGRGSLAELALADGTRVNAGERTEVEIAAADSLSSLNISGVAVVDRRTAPAPILVSAYGDGQEFEVMLAASRVFLDSVGEGAVFVKEGGADVSQDGILLASLAAGEGLDLQPAVLVVEPGGVLPDISGGVPLPEPGAAPELTPPVRLPPGLGVPAPPPPPPVAQWSDGRVEDAFALVGLTV